MGIILILLSVIVLLVSGILERRSLNKNVKQIELRINVNGIRGKSTATRFITSILEAAGYQVVGKTTGTSARMIVWNEAEEREIKRKPMGPNIGEQVSVIKETVNLGANALVCECMAVNPEYQRIYQHQIIQANVVVITNVVEDHLDEMGPTTDQIAQAFAETIPYNGTLVLTQGPYNRYFRIKAAKRNTRVVCVSQDEISEDYLAKFSYLVFPNNCAIGLAFAKAMGIDEKMAMQAMLDARPDPGSTRIVHIERENKQYWLVNAFAANEPSSSLEIWETIQKSKIEVQHRLLVLCCRDDRVDRTHQFVKDFLPEVVADEMLIIGTGTKEVVSAFKEDKFPNVAACTNLTSRSAETIIAELDRAMDQSMVFCAGNIHGVAEKFLEDFAAIKI